MSWADDVISSARKAIGDRPVVMLVGVSDLVTEKLRELPDALTAWQDANRDLPLRAAGAMVGSAFRANLKIGELYDEVNRRGEDVMAKMRGDHVYAEEDEPFVHEPFMPVPLRSVAPTKTAPRSTAKSTAGRKTAAKKKAAKKTAAESAPVARTTARARKSAGR